MRQLLRLFVNSANNALYCVYLSFLKINFSALRTNPCGNIVETDMNILAIKGYVKFLQRRYRRKDARHEWGILGREKLYHACGA